LAPKDKFPAGLNDCWQAYSWLLEHYEQYGIDKNFKIIVAGDSAGATLSLGVAFMAMKQ